MSLSNTPLDGYFGLFSRHHDANGRPRLIKQPDGPTTIPDPGTGRPLKVSTLEDLAHAICPRCTTKAEGGFVSFVGDLRLAYACPTCEQLVWLPGA